MDPNATNADDQGVQTPVVDDDKPVTEDDLRSLKYPEEDVETPQGEDEPAEGDDSEEEAEEPVADEDESPEDAEQNVEEETQQTFVKEFPNIKGDTPEEYAKNLEIAYQNSTAEAMRLKNELQPAPPAIPETPEPPVAEEPQQQQSITDPTSLFVKQQMDREIDKAYSDFRKEYSQVEDMGNYQQFTRTVATVSKTIFETEGRLVDPREAYDAAAAILKWEKTSVPTDKEKLGMALKQNGAASKSTSASAGKQVTRSKVTDEMIKANQKMYPGKSVEEIRKELEPYVN